MFASVSSAPATGTVRHHRSVKNYLLDYHFQLKYTAYLAAVAVVLSTVLGAMLWWVGREVISQSQQTVAQGQEAVRLGQEVVAKNKDLSDVVRMNIVKDSVYGSDPHLAAVFNEEARKEESKRLEQQRKLEIDARALMRRSMQLAEQKELISLGLIVVLSLLVLGIGLAGIVVTHKVAGPIFKMKRLLSHVGDGHLRIRERLRKGDELHHFFSTFERMVDSLRQRQQEEINKLDEAIRSLEKTVPADQLALLHALRRQMQKELDSPPESTDQSGPPAAAPSGVSSS
jgi:nitrogen fixation/metabolism regulation signal transduction histidine kinase